MSEHIHNKVMILGSGAAGLTAAIYTARASLGAGADPRHAARRSDDHHHRCGELSRLRRHRSGARGSWSRCRPRPPMSAPEFDQPIRSSTSVDFGRRPFHMRRRFSGDSLQRAMPLIVSTGRAGANGSASTARQSAQGLRRVGLRDLRRLLLPRKRRWWWSAAATPPPRRRCTSTNHGGPASPWSTAATRCAPSASCRTACSTDDKHRDRVEPRSLEEVHRQHRRHGAGRDGGDACANVKTRARCVSELAARRPVRGHRPRPRTPVCSSGQLDMDSTTATSITRA